MYVRVCDRPLHALSSSMEEEILHATIHIDGPWTTIKIHTTPIIHLDNRKGKNGAGDRSRHIHLRLILDDPCSYAESTSGSSALALSVLCVLCVG